MPRRRAERRGPRLWHVWIVLPLAFVAAIAIAAGVFFTGWDLLGARELKPERRIDSKTLFDLVKLSFGVVAGAGALVALVVAYRRQRVDEDGALREATRLHAERFSTAVDKLGSDSPAVRLGGVHALAGLADDAPTQELRQTCIDVLCAYLQLPYTPDPGDDPAHQEEHHSYLAFRKVRHTILRLIGDHYRLPHAHPRSWQGCDPDLTGVTIDCDLDFSGASFSSGTVVFNHATFSAGPVSFNHATFSGSAVYFYRAAFSGGIASFGETTFSGGTVSFGDAIFCGHPAASYGGVVSFGGARFSGGTVYFSGATFSGGTAAFNAATFSGGTVTFDNATFSGSEVLFGGATGPAPDGLLTAVGTPPPTTVSLPPDWLASSP